MFHFTHKQKPKTVAAAIRNNNIKLSAAVLMLSIATAQFYWLCAFKGFGVNIALADALGTNSLLYGLFLILEYGFVGGSTHPVLRYGIIGGQSVLLTAVWLYACNWILQGALQNKEYLLFWEDTYYIRGLVGWILICDYSLMSFFVKRAIRNERLGDMEQKSQELRKEAELFKLRQQLHPHFLFNSLNSINALIGKDPKQARQMVQQLSDFLRNTLKKEDNDLISVREEMADLAIYLNIEKVRFGHRLSFAENITEDCMDQAIPPFLLQPLVENAIKYGLYGTTGEVEIKISGTMEGQMFHFTITNPYDADAVSPKGTGFGLQSVQRRLYLLFARNDLLQTKSTAKTDNTQDDYEYYTASILIPVQANGK
ncbi:MAG: histidine kinase [Edaphocola sp.]